MRTTRPRPQADINVTPLVDVVLVLLIIFMVVAPALQAGVQVQLPSILHFDEGSDASQPTTVTVGADGRYFLEKEAYELDVLSQKLRSIHDAAPERRVILKADIELGYGKVRQVFKVCQDLGFPGVSLQVLDRANRKG